MYTLSIDSIDSTGSIDGIDSIYSIGKKYGSAVVVTTLYTGPGPGHSS